MMRAPRYSVPVRFIYLGGVFLALVSALLFQSRDRQIAMGALRLDLQRHAYRIDQEIRAKIEVVHSLRGFFDASEFVSRVEFGEFARQALARHPQIRALEWVPRVERDEIERFEAAARADGLHDFEIGSGPRSGPVTPVTSSAVAGAATRSVFPVFYAEPLSANREALGFDVVSSPARAEALMMAWRTGEAYATSAISMVQDEAGGEAFLVFVPIYQGPTPPDPQGREQLLEGFAVGVIPIAGLVDGHEAGEGYALRLIDESENAKGSGRLLGAWEDASAERHASAIVLRHPIPAVNGRDWFLELATQRSHALHTLSTDAAFASVSALCVTMLLANFFHARQRRREEDAKVQEEIRLIRTQKLESIAQLAAGVAHEINTPAQYVKDSIGFLSESYGDLRGMVGSYRAFAEAVDDRPVAPEALPALRRQESEIDLAFLDTEVPRAIDHAREGLDRVTEIVQALSESSTRDFAEHSPFSGEVDPFGRVDSGAR